MMRWLALAAVMVLLVGCGDPLVTQYGKTDGTSVNGIHVLKQEWQRRFSSRDMFRLSSKVDACDLLIHVDLDGSLPTATSCAFIRTWLLEQDGRQFVLVLRDGNVAPWLCRRWAEQARAEAATTSGVEARGLVALAESLESRAIDEEDPPHAIPGGRETCDLFSRVGKPDLAPVTLAGIHVGPAPSTMRMRSVPEAAACEPLVLADDGEQHRDWAISVPYGESRLVVIANATPLLDGALVDRHARALLASLMDDLQIWRAKSEIGGTAAWLSSLSVREGDPEPPNILALLFGRPPLSWVVAHLCAIALAVLAYRAAWLGRISARRLDTGERFSRHIDALAWHLRQADAIKACSAALAAHAGRKPPSPPASLGEARAQAAALPGPPTDRYRRKPKEHP